MALPGMFACLCLPTYCQLTAIDALTNYTDTVYTVVPSLPLLSLLFLPTDHICDFLIPSNLFRSCLFFFFFFFLSSIIFGYNHLYNMQLLSCNMVHCIIVIMRGPFAIFMTVQIACLMEHVRA